MRIRTAIVILIFAIPMTYCSKATKPNSETQVIVEDFFKTLEHKGNSEAIERLFDKNKWMSPQILDTLSSQLSVLINQVGQYHGYEKIRERQYGERIIQFTYIAKYERQPLKFIFRFYKPNDKWQPQSVNMETDFIELELDEASRAYRFKENFDPD